jgi:hypothetical protein
MSIWCSWPHIGTESGDWYEVLPGGERGPKVVHLAERGVVVAYASGFSNHHPDYGDPPATVTVAHIAPWCVPGHDEREVDEPECGPWLRLDIDSPNAVTWWTKDGEKPTAEPIHGSVVLDEAAARSLAADLLEWADRPHLTPRPTS